jgi:hypothetical protein
MFSNFHFGGLAYDYDTGSHIIESFPFLEQFTLHLFTNSQPTFPSYSHLNNQPHLKNHGH